MISLHQNEFNKTINIQKPQKIIPFIVFYTMKQITQKNDLFRLMTFHKSFQRLKVGQMYFSGNGDTMLTKVTGFSEMEIR